MTLTNTAIDSMAVGAELKDDRVTGLSIRRHASGHSFMLFYRTRVGQKRRPKIGDYPLLSISKARDIARDMLVAVAAGGDPVAQREAARGEPTMDDLWTRVKAEHYNRGTEWDREAERIWKSYLKVKLGRLRVGAVCYDDIDPVHKAMKDTPVQANLALSVASTMLSMAEKFGSAGAKWRPVNSNPCNAVTRYPARKRKRKAAPDEIAAIGAKLQAELAAEPPSSFPTAAEWRLNRVRQVVFIYLLIFSGARPSEIAKLEPKMIERYEAEDGTVYGAFSLHGKTSDDTGEDRRVFLPPQAMAAIDLLPKGGIPLRHRDGTQGRCTVTGLAKAPRDMWARIKPPGMWIRDWRRTFGSVALSNGITRDQLGEILGHASQQTTMIYSKLYEAEAATATAVTAALLEKMLSVKSSV